MSNMRMRMYKEPVWNWLLSGTEQRIWIWNQSHQKEEWRFKEATGFSKWTPPICYRGKAEQIEKSDKQADRHHDRIKPRSSVALHK